MQTVEKKVKDSILSVFTRQRSLERAMVYGLIHLLVHLPMNFWR